MGDQMDEVFQLEIRNGNERKSARRGKNDTGMATFPAGERMADMLAFR